MYFKTLASRAKDTVLQHAAAWAANRFHLNRLGWLTTLRLNSIDQQIFMIVELRGEQTPVEFTIRYRILGPTEIEVTEVQASREWMAIFVNEVVSAEQKRFSVSPMIVKALTRFTS